MGVKILLVLACALVSTMAAATGEDHLPGHKDSEQPVDWYDCSGKDLGNYNHPHDCTKFMTCAPAGAYERDCAACHVHPDNCPEGRLHYNEPQDKCLWADEAGCSAGGGPTHAPPTTTTQASEERPVEGTPCDPEDADKCWTNGDCHDYWWCERDHSDHKGEGKPGTWRYGKCNQDFNLYFNPHRANNSVHGGVCDHWTNLDDDLKDQYNKDPSCIDPHCEWRELEECGTHYEYMHPKETDGDFWVLDCPNLNTNSMSANDQLLWSQREKNCLHCSEVKREDGTACCAVVY